MATIAIDDARLFQEQEREHVDLETSIASLCEDLERLRAGEMNNGVEATILSQFIAGLVAK